LAEAAFPIVLVTSKKSMIGEIIFDWLAVFLFTILRRLNSKPGGNMSKASKNQPVIGIVMGSDSDWPVMQAAAKVLEEFGVPYEARIVSAHRTPDLLFEYAETAHLRGLKAIIAGAGGAAHLPGMLAAKTTVPILGVPIPSKHLKGLDSLLSIVQMPKGVPVATFAIGEAGASNAALFAIAMQATNAAGSGGELADKLHDFRQRQESKVLSMQLPRPE
jgi:5-(carboxyamino)imidazole ribonucleotide mutase